jgi:glycosyltransferase involved in cell wall biosynthesis
LRARLYDFLEWAAVRMAHATIAYVTEDLRSHYRRAHRDLRTMVIPNGVADMDRSRFPHPTEMHPDCFNVVMVGRLDIVKGTHVAIEAIASEDVPPNIHLYLIGTGPCETELRILAQNRGIASRVHLLGFRRNIYDYLAHCHILLMPSLHEGLPYTLLEAMAFGIPPIATRVGGLAEVIRDGVTGLLVPERDPASFARAIQRLHMDSELRMRLGEQARARQQSKYSLESMTEHYVELYRAISLVDSESR